MDQSLGYRSCRLSRQLADWYRFAMRDLTDSAAWTEKGALRVPQITALFWVVKGLSTALGESTSD